MRYSRGTADRDRYINRKQGSGETPSDLHVEVGREGAYVGMLIDAVATGLRSHDGTTLLYSNMKISRLITASVLLL